MQVVRYISSQSLDWDAFVKESKNGTFLFLRPYMDYHSDRFADHSLMYYDAKGRLIAVLPANQRGDRLYSHQGLTYGGFILSPRIHAEEVGQLFAITADYLHGQQISEWYYKPMPTIYHRMPSQDDEYWLWKMGAELIDCSLMTAIPIHPYANLLSASKRNNSNRLLRQGYVIDMDAPLCRFWPILTANLSERFHASPVHSYDEMVLLMSRFPDNIRCCTVCSPDGTPLAGTILYYTADIVKAQYTSASHEGKRMKVLDLLFTQIIDHLRRCSVYRYLDFGTSMLADSTDLNLGLVAQKEGFGGRGITSKVYVIRCLGASPLRR